MPIYACYGGDCVLIALIHPDCFTLTDDSGREWVCIETSLPDLSNAFPAAAAEVMRVQALAHKLGLSSSGSARNLFDAPDRESLARVLGSSIGPAGKSDDMTSTLKEVLTLPEAAAYLRAEEDKVRELAERGSIPAQNVGGEWRFLKSALHDWLRWGTLPAKAGALPPLRPRPEGLIDKLLLDEIAREIAVQLAGQTTEATKTPSQRIRELVGIWKDDESVPAMIEDIYRQRKQKRRSKTVEEVE